MYMSCFTCLDQNAKLDKSKTLFNEVQRSMFAPKVFNNVIISMKHYHVYMNKRHKYVDMHTRLKFVSDLTNVR